MVELSWQDNTRTEVYIKQEGIRGWLAAMEDVNKQVSHEPT